MTNINRTLVLNPVEPAPFSMKLRSGLETFVSVEYLRQNGAPYDTDFGAQLYLISRSFGTVYNYLLPSTDVINGRARAVIPAGAIKDANGYNVQIIGSVEGEPRLIAKGYASVYETEALGIIPADLIDTVDITLSYNENASLDVNLWQDAGRTLEYDLAGSSISATVWTKSGGSAIAPFVVTVLDNNTVRLTMPDTAINSLPAQCWWSMSITSGAGMTTLAQGDVLVTGTPVPVFTKLDFGFNYTKQATLVAPTSGKCIHCNNALDILRFSMYDKDGVDQSVYLNQMRIGGTITLLTPPPPPPEPGPPDPLPTTLILPRDTDPPIPVAAGTTWTIVSVDRVEGINYFQFVVTPTTQAPETGNQTFTFVRG